MVAMKERNDADGKPRAAQPRTGALVIPESELTFSASRSGGPGGQNVNKVSSKVEVRWNLISSKVLTLEEKGRIANSPALKNRISTDGDLIIVEQSTRSYGQNRKLAVEKLHDLVRSALKKKRKRVRTRPTRASKERRLTAKRSKAKKKASRKKVGDSD